VELYLLSLEKVNIYLLSDLEGVLLGMISEFLFYLLLGSKVSLIIDLSNLLLVPVLLRNPNKRSIRLLDTLRLK